MKQRREGDFEAEMKRRIERDFADWLNYSFEIEREILK
jgi:hypothetical protein